MIGHAIDRDKLLFMVANDSGDVFVEFFFIFLLDQILPSLHREDNLDVDLCVGVCHDFPRIADCTCRSYGASLCCDVARL